MEALTNNQRTMRVTRLLELLENVNESLALHQVQPDPDQLAINQYKQLRDEYVQELNSLLPTFGLQGTLTVDSDQVEDEKRHPAWNNMMAYFFDTNRQSLYRPVKESSELAAEPSIQYNITASSYRDWLYKKFSEEAERDFFLQIQDKAMHEDLSKGVRIGSYDTRQLDQIMRNVAVLLASTTSQENADRGKQWLIYQLLNLDSEKE